MGIVQTFKFAGSGITGGGTSVYTLSLPVAVNDEIVLAVVTNQTATIPSVTDDLGNIYSEISGQAGGSDSHFFSVWNAVVTVAGTPTITVTINPTFGGTTNILTEGMTLAGLGLIELTSPVHNQGFSSSWASEVLTPAQANEILVTFDVGYDPPAVITDDFVSDESGTVGSPPVQLDMAHKIVTAIDAYQSHWSQAGSSEWLTVLVSFPSVCSPGVTLTFTLGDVDGNPLQGAVVLTLCNAEGLIFACAKNIPQTVIKVQANDSGVGSVTFYGNHQITPPGTFYDIAIQPPNDGASSIGRYRFSSAGTFDLSSLTPLL